MKRNNNSPYFRGDIRHRCCVAPSPQLRERIRERLRGINEAPGIGLGGRIVVQPQQRPGFNDGLIIPGSEYPLGTPLRIVRRAAAARAPLRGAVRVIVVLVDFTDAPMAARPDHFRDLFFSTGKIPTGSVREYFTEVSHGLLTLAGEVVGPYRLPRTLAVYAGGKAGTDNPEPNARTMARDAATLANRGRGLCAVRQRRQRLRRRIHRRARGTGRRGDGQREPHLVPQMGADRRRRSTLTARRSSVT